MAKRRRQKSAPGPSSAATPGVAVPREPEEMSSSDDARAFELELADAFLFSAATIALLWVAPLLSPYATAIVPPLPVFWGPAVADGAAEGALIGLGQFAVRRWRGAASPMGILFSAVAFAVAQGIFAGTTLLVAPALLWLALGGLIGAAWTSLLPSESQKGLIVFVAGVALGFSCRELLGAAPGTGLETLADALPGIFALPGGTLAWRAAPPPASESRGRRQRP